MTIKNIIKWVLIGVVVVFVGSAVIAGIIDSGEDEAKAPDKKTEEPDQKESKPKKTEELLTVERLKETWEEKLGSVNYNLGLGDFNDEDNAWIGDSKELLMGVNDPSDITEIQIISRDGHTANNMNEMIALMSTLIRSIDDDTTISIDDIDYIEKWLRNNETKDLGDHKISVDGDINGTHYIFVYINKNK